MSLIMTQPEHYPMNNHDNSPTQSSMGYINSFPQGNQWQQVNRSPNSMGNGSPMNSTMMPTSSMNMPAAPSPLLNSVNSSAMMSNPPNLGMVGTPQQPGSVKTPLSVQQQQSNSVLLRNPFEEDMESRPVSRQQMPPPTSNNQRLYFDMVKEFRSQLYCHTNDPMFRFRLPMAYNTVGSEQIRYPSMNLNRSQSIPVQKLVPPPPQMPPMQMPVTSTAPAPAPSKRRTTKKQKEQQQQEQLQSPQLNGMPGFPHGISPMAMEMNRPCSSHDFSNCDPRARNSPGSLPMHMKALGRSPSMPDGFGHMPPRNIKLMPNEKCATEGFQCTMCGGKITNEKRGIRCTAMGQGCYFCYHIDCAGLYVDAYNQLITDPRCEWICKNCQQSSNVIYHA